jgi:hypothetical protein
MRRHSAATTACALALVWGAFGAHAAPAKAADAATLGSCLVTGTMRPVFDHLDGFVEQLDAAIASRCTVMYASGLGALSYGGLPPKARLETELARMTAYNRRARAGGIGIVLSYLCATSIVNLDTFAANWDDYFPGRPVGFAPGKMLQQDINGNNLPSWYGGAYAPADMWNPYWRQYTRHGIKLAVASGHDGVFFDNPTVHLNGNYSPYAMAAWHGYLKRAGVDPGTSDLPGLRALTRTQPRLWREFRTTEAADFIAEMRRYGRNLKSGFIITANNSLNSWDSFYSQPQGFAYSIPQQSRGQDFVTIEDMGSQPRRQGAGYVSYAGTLRMLPAISSGRALSICTIDGNYTSPPDFMGLAIAECTAHDAAYMVWSCWDAAFRAASAATVARYHGFLGAHQALIAHTKPVADLLLVWPYENWLVRSDCPTACLARELSARNLQYDVVTEADLTLARLKAYHTVAYPAAESLVRPRTSDLLRQYERGGGTVVSLVQGSDGKPDSEIAAKTCSPEALQARLSPLSVAVEGGPGVRAVVRRTKAGACVLHLYNLDVARGDNYHDTVTPAGNVRVSWVLPPGQSGAKRVRLLTPDPEGTSGPVAFRTTRLGSRTRLDLVVKKLWIWTVVTLG